MQGVERKFGYFVVDFSIAFDLCKISNSFEQKVGYTRRATASAGNFYGGFGFYFGIEKMRRTGNDACQYFQGVIFHTDIDPKTSSERRSKQARTCSSANQCEWIERNLNRTSVRARVYHNVYFVVLHSGVQIFFYYRA